MNPSCSFYDVGAGFKANCEKRKPARRAVSGLGWFRKISDQLKRSPAQVVSTTDEPHLILRVVSRAAKAAVRTNEGAKFTPHNVRFKGARPRSVSGSVANI